MNFRRLVLFVAAGLAGWWGVAWSEGASKADTLRTARSSAAPPSTAAAAAASLQAIQRPEAGSTELSRIAALVAAIPADGLSAAQKHIESWPPGAARQFARAVLDARKPAEPAKGEAATPRDPAEPPSNLFRDLAETMSAGNLPNGTSAWHDGGSYNNYTLCYWVSADPATATAAILKLPQGSNRRLAVDAAAEVMARHDPAAAMVFVLKSGEPLQIGASIAWAKSVIENPATDRVRQYLDRMTLAQQNSLFTALAKKVPDLNWNAGYTEYDDANINAKDPLHRSDLGVIACGVLEAKGLCPGMEALIRNLSYFPHVAEEVRQYLESRTFVPSPIEEGATITVFDLTAVEKSALAILAAERLKNAAASGGDAGYWLGVAWYDNLNARGADPDAVLERAAPALLPQLARSGRLPEAVQLLDDISDPDIRRTSLEAVLPYWMAADPNAARAAFNAAPLTALERERWQRHPAFLKDQQH